MARRGWVEQWFSLALTQLFVFLHFHADEVLERLLHNGTAGLKTHGHTNHADRSSKMAAPGFNPPSLVAEVSVKLLHGCIQWRLEANARCYSSEML